ncbi:MAG: hypothetical protein EOP56_09730 [Sphingobacteriales bacterium]|nr:MAG: hypothetical protein EOP56_09730 [Sphingobacteriales bacterium]
MENREQTNDRKEMPDTTKKKDGVTSAFSAATSASYSGQDIERTANIGEDDTDKVRFGSDDKNGTSQDDKPIMRPLEGNGI